MKVLITGADGFIGKMLMVRLSEESEFFVSTFVRDQPISLLKEKIAEVDSIVHLAGENRPVDPSQFMAVNSQLTNQICAAIKATGRSIPLVYTSSIKALQETLYGISKRAGEDAVTALSSLPGQSCAIFRLPNVFGKWCRPNYNSAVATFCHNIARDLPIKVDDPEAPLTLAYIDDVAKAIIEVLRSPRTGLSWPKIEPTYTTTVGAVVNLIRSFRASRETLTTEAVGTGLKRALYATYVSYLPPEKFSYSIPAHRDSRGIFVEMLRTPDCGQFSYFTAHPGVTRGGHYHHSKTEKFLVVSGTARFKFRHIMSGETYELVTQGSAAEIVDTAPGWAHDITNIGDTELVVMLWANELFDPALPDTITAPL